MKVLGIIGKILAGIAVLFGISLIVLGNIGGNGDQYKTMLEEMISDASGYNAKITTLNNVRFFPNLIIDFDGLQLMPQESEVPVITMESLAFKAGLFDAMFGEPKVKIFDLENLSISKGLYTRERLAITRLGIDDPAEGQPSLSLTGTLGADPIRAKIDLSGYGQGVDRAFDLGDRRHLLLSVKGLNLEGEMDNLEPRHIVLNEFTLKQGADMIVSGDVDVQVSGQSAAVKADLKVGANTQIQPDVQASSGALSGKITLPVLHVEDLDRVAKALAPLGAIAPEKAKDAKDGIIDLSGLDIDVELDLKSVLAGGKEIASMTLPVEIKSGSLKAEADKGAKILSGAGGMKIAMIPQTSGVYVVSSNVNIDNGSLADFIPSKKQSISFPFDLSVTGNASVKRWDQITAALDGEMSVVTENAELQSRLLNVWGDGLTSLILPSLKPSEDARIACGVVYAPIAKGVADFQTLFIDGAHVQINGKGTYSLVEDKLNLKISPKTKDISIGDISTAVRIKGPLASPSVGIDKADAGKKAAGLLLGAINPAFLAIAATDMSLGNGDLCEQVAALSSSNKASAVGKMIRDAQAEAQ